MAQVHVDQKEWGKVSQADKDRITEIMRTTGLIKAADTIVGSAAPSSPAAKFSAPNPGCVLACNAGEGAAVAACAALAPPFNMICVGVAHAAAAYCRGQC
jgi:hypothetical protein